MRKATVWFLCFSLLLLSPAMAISDCAQDATCPLNAFSDLSPTGWYHDGIHYCLEHKLLSGLPGNLPQPLFAPNDAASRGQIVHMLYLLEGTPKTDAPLRFTDVAEGAVYRDAVCWATEAGIVNGYRETQFAPEDAVTREQLAAILWRYAVYRGLDVRVGENTNILSYEDAFEISEWAFAPFQWCCGAGLMSGFPSGYLQPQGMATRAQAAQILLRFCL